MALRALVTISGVARGGRDADLKRFVLPGWRAARRCLAAVQNCNLRISLHLCSCFLSTANHQPLFSFSSALSSFGFARGQTDSKALNWSRWPCFGHVLSQNVRPWRIQTIRWDATLRFLRLETAHLLFVLCFWFFFSLLVDRKSVV